MTYFHTDNHTLLNDDGCDVQSEYMCQIQGLDIGMSSFTCIVDMSAHVLLTLLNELRKSDKMRGLPSILSLFRNAFNKFKTGARK